MKLRPVLLAAAAAIAAWLAIFGDKTPAGGIAEPVARAASATPARSAAPAGGSIAAPAPSRSASSAPAGEREPFILALQPRDTLIGGAHGAAPSAALFTSQSWTPPPPPPPKPAPPPPPAAPPLPFTYLGKKVEGGVWEVYLARGDQTFIAREQTVIEGSYRVDSIKPPALSLTYLPLNQVQMLTIGGND